jgi:tetratricopeptide (TPR) repeat protein
MSDKSKATRSSHIAAAKLKVAIATKTGETLPDWIRELAARDLADTVPQPESPSRPEPPAAPESVASTPEEYWPPEGVPEAYRPKILAALRREYEKKMAALEVSPREASSGQAVEADEQLGTGGFPEAARLAVQGYVLIDAGRNDEAVAAFEQAVRLKPDNSSYHVGLGHALAAAGRNDEAVAAFEQAVRLEPDVSEYRAALDRALSNRGSRSPKTNKD